MINIILKKVFFKSVGEGLFALPNSVENITDSNSVTNGQLQGAVPTKAVMLLLFFCWVLFLTACTKGNERKEVIEKQTETVEIVEVKEEFPIPELNKDNIKDVNAVLMEQLRQDLIDESREISSEDENIEKLLIDEVKKPELEIEIDLPVFEIDDQE